jgi:CheY-like chemotaxis protein
VDRNSAKLSVLIVDDDLGILETMSDILAEKDFLVTIASDGFKAIELVREKHFDAIIMDVRMPGLDGVETFKKMKKIKRLPKTIFITAYALEDMIQEAKAEGAIAVLIKPIDIEALDSMLKSNSDSGHTVGTGTFC